MPESVPFLTTDLVPQPLVLLAVMTHTTDTESHGKVPVTVASVEVYHSVDREVGVGHQIDLHDHHSTCCLSSASVCVNLFYAIFVDARF